MIDGGRTPPCLPRSVAALERSFHAAPDDRARGQIMELIRAEFPAWRTTRPGRSLRQSSDARLFIRRMLACVRRPIIEHTPGLSDTVACSQTYALRDLVHFDREAIIPLMRKLARSREQLIREVAVLHLSWTGLDRVIPDVLRFLRSSDRRVVEQAARGASLAAFHKLATAGYRRALFAALAPLVTGDRRFGPGVGLAPATGHAPEALIRIDPARALRLLKSDRCLHAENNHVWEILMTLHTERGDRPRTFGASISPRILWTLYERTMAATAGSAEERRAWTCALILTFTADSDPGRTRREAKSLERASADWPGYKGTEEIKEALRRCKGIPQTQVTLERLNRRPRDFSRRTAGVLRAFELGHHVIDDGLILYLHNCATSLDLALSGLRTLGLSALNQKIRAAAKIIQPRGSSRTPRSMRKAVLALSDAQQDQLIPLSKAVEHAAPGVIAAAERFIDANTKNGRIHACRPGHHLRI